MNIFTPLQKLGHNWWKNHKNKGNTFGPININSFLYMMFDTFCNSFIVLTDNGEITIFDSMKKYFVPQQKMNYL